MGKCKYYLKRKKQKPVAKDCYYKIYQSIIGNYLFYLTLLYCLYWLSLNKKYNSSYIQLLISFFVASGIGYICHYLSHFFKIRKYYSDCRNIFTENKYINSFLLKVVEGLEFHDRIHHDTKINKKWNNIFREIIGNSLLEGVGLVLFIKFMDIRVILLWALSYATIHNINYSIMPPTTHRDHHINKGTNYGYDLMDIIFNTQYNDKDIEIHNHGAINLFLVTWLLTAFFN